MRRAAAIALALIGLLAQATPAAASAAVDQLVRNAHYWQDRGREDKAVEAWGKVLVAAPDSAEALVALAGYNARVERPLQAREFLGRLKEAHPSHPEIPRLERMLDLGRRFDQILAEARALVREGRTEAGIARYRELFAGTEPPRWLALEYYQTLGGSAKGWPEGRQGLERLAKASPDDPRIRLALARHLTYREPTRKEGLRHLAELASDPALQRETRTAWKEALTWLPPTADSELLFRVYLERFPGDAEIGTRLEAAVRRRERSARLAGGYAALDRGDLTEAVGLFEQAGADDPEAVAGLGLVALRRDDFDGARTLLLRAKKLAPDRPKVWAEPLQAASFWALVRQAAAEREAGREDAAEAKLLAAIETAPAERAHADRLLADLYRSEGRTEEAEARLRRLLEESPEDASLLRDMVGLLAGAGRLEEAVEANRRLASADPTMAVDEASLTAELLRSKAAAAAREGRYAEARVHLTDARDVAPDNRWVLHDLANLLLVMQEAEQAVRVAEALSKLDPEGTAARITLARALAAHGRPDQAIEQLKAIPPATRTTEIEALQRRLEIDHKVQRLVARMSAGAAAESRQQLVGLEVHLGDRPELVPVIARAWAELGEVERAIRLLQAAREKHPEQAGSQRLQLATLLHQADRDEEAAALLRDLRRDPSVPPSERRGREDLRVAVAVRRADRLRQAGRLDAAIDELEEVLPDHPENPKILCALGRVFATGESHREAHAAFLRALATDRNDREARSGAAEAALRMGEPAEARRLVEEGLQRAPDDPRMVLLAGHVAERAGDDRQAIRHLRLALALARKAGGEPPGAPRPLGEEVSELTPASSSSTMLLLARRRFGRDGLADVAPQSTPSGLVGEITEALHRTESRHRIFADPALEVRRREGEPGFGLLTEWRLPLQAGIPVGYAGQLALQVTPVLLDAGGLPLGTPEVALRHGAGQPFPGGAAVAGAGARGTELSLRFLGRQFRADLGTTPLGFPVMSIVGGLDWRPRLGPVDLRLEAFRRPVTDSLLSMAGVRDTATGRVWGGVFGTGGRLEASFAGRPARWFGFGDFRLLSGAGVADNSAVQAGGGADLLLHRQDEQQLRAGAILSYMGFRRNLSGFTLGHGGYFSPQDFVHVGVPVSWQGRSGRMRWDLTAEPGLNWFHEEAAPWFPADPRLQQDREAARDDRGSPLRSSHAPRTAVGFAFNARGQLAVPLGEGSELAARLDLHRAADYQEVVASVAVRFGLRPFWQ